MHAGPGVNPIVPATRLATKDCENIANLQEALKLGVVRPTHTKRQMVKQDTLFMCAFLCMYLLVPYHSPTELKAE